MSFLRRYSSQQVKNSWKLTLEFYSAFSRNQDFPFSITLPNFPYFQFHSLICPSILHQHRQNIEIRAKISWCLSRGVWIFRGAWWGAIVLTLLTRWTLFALMILKWPFMLDAWICYRIVIHGRGIRRSKRSASGNSRLTMKALLWSLGINSSFVEGACVNCADSWI